MERIGKYREFPEVTFGLVEDLKVFTSGVKD
jgi:hypothetical protein